MIQYPKKIRNYNAFVDGRSYAGRATTAQLPEVNITTERHRGAGMDGGTPVDMGQGDMQSTMSIAEWVPDLITLAGRRERLVLRPVERSVGVYDDSAFICTVGGLWTVTNFSELSAGSDVPMQLTLEADYFRMVKDGVELFEIDILSGKRVIGGTDQLRAQRRAMGF